MPEIKYDYPRQNGTVFIPDFEKKSAVEYLKIGNAIYQILPKFQKKSIKSMNTCFG